MYDEAGLLLTPNFYDYHAIHALEMPELKDGFIESPSPFTPLDAKGLGEGGGGGLHAVAAAIQDALRPVGSGIVDVLPEPVGNIVLRHGPVNGSGGDG